MEAARVDGWWPFTNSIAQWARNCRMVYDKFHVQQHADKAVDFEHGCLRPRYGCREAQFDLAEAPLPAFELLDPERYNRLTVQISRGCPFRCEFCASSVLLSPSYRQKPLAKVLAEIRKINSLWRRPFIEFAD